MEPAPQRNYRGSRANGHVEGGGPGRRTHHGNRRWVADGVPTGRGGTSTPHAGGDGERWERGGHRGSRGRGRGSRGKFGNTSVTFRRNGVLDGGATGSEGEHSEMEEEHEVEEQDTNESEIPEEREKFWQELIKAREAERKRAIAEGKMDDPNIPKRLEDAITMVGTCVDMCPRFERYRRERENNLFEWETIPGTKRVDHERAVKAYERAAGDKTLPSDLRPPDVLKRTLDYLFHELLPLGGFSETFNFIRDRSRAVRNDFTMQHETGPTAIECHDRCARFHILALHVERDRQQFSISMEEQQLMNTLQSLKEFYQDQRGHYQSPTELEMRIYHRLIHIRDQRDRHDDIPPALLNHPVFELTTKFRARVQAKSAPITKTSPLAVDGEAMGIFAELADVLRREGDVVMTYLIACILERHFGKDTIEDIESIRGELSLSDIIDGYSGMCSQDQDTDIDISVVDENEAQDKTHESLEYLQPSGTQWLTDAFVPNPTQSAFLNATPADSFSHLPATSVHSAFSNLKTTPNAFGNISFGTPSVFTGPATSSTSTFGTTIDNKLLTSSSPQPEATTTVSSATPPPIPNFQSFGATQATVQVATPSSQAEHTHTSFLQHSPQANGPPCNAAKKTTFDAEMLTSALNPMAPSFIPVSNFVGANAGFSVTPSTSVSSPTHVIASTSKESPASITQQPRLPLAPDATLPEISFVSSPPSVESVPIEGAVGQTPPSQPPLLSRRQPISLPPTPTATLFIPSSLTGTRKSIFSSLKGLQTTPTPVSALPSEILSPLVLHSPAPRPFSSINGPSRRESVQSPPKAVAGTADVTMEAEAESSTKKLNPVISRPPTPTRKPSLDIMEATALHFARRGWLAKQAFLKWRQRLSDRARWMEACRRSMLYKEKAEAGRLSRSLIDRPLTYGRRSRTTSSEIRAPLKKRLRERLSGEYRPPANDEELARRFEKNHEDHNRRWARGSFLNVLKNFLESAKSPIPDGWSAWLSLNQESDGTAIWLERKFDVPESGEWKNENVFHIPISKNRESARTHPGVIVFERTPLLDVTDILGRKYHVLEDCTRLREVIQAFPADRHYVPSLLCIAWSERDPEASKDFDDMITSMVEGGMLTSTHELIISMGGLDMESKLDEVLHVIPFDLEGRLVKHVSLNDLFDIWEHEWKETTTRWLGNCSIYGQFNWDLYARLLECSVRLLTQIINYAIGLLRDDDITSDIPQLELVKGMNSETMFDAVLDWLRGLPETDFTGSLMNDIRAHRDLGREFPTITFLYQLYALARPVAAHVLDVDPDVARFVSRTRLDDGVRGVRTLEGSLEDELRACYLAKLKPLKRLASFGEPSLEWSRTPSPRSKKQRVSVSETDEETSSLSFGPSSPSASTATSDGSEPRTIVTPAMLRLLTQDVRAKYGG